MGSSFLLMSDPKIPPRPADASATRHGRADAPIPREIRVLGRARPFGLSGVMPRRGARVSILCLALFACASDAALPGPRVAMEVYRAVDDWVRDWRVEDATRVEGVGLASVTIRLDGSVLGRGAATSAQEPDTPVHAQAARRAIARARATLRTRSDGEEPDWSALAQRVTLGVELGAEPAPLSPGAARSPMLGLSPGVHALAVRLGERWGVMTPDEQITRGVTGRRALATLAANLTGEGGMLVAPIEELLALELEIAHARTVWIAQPGEGLGAVFLDRGGRFIPPREIASDRLGEIARSLAAALRAQRWPGSERFGLAGTRDALSGRSDPAVAPPFEQGLVIIALARQGARHGDRASLGAAAALTGDLSAVEPGEAAPWDDPVSAASVVVALREIERAGIPLAPELAGLETRCVQALGRAFERGTFAPDIPGSARGLVAWALVMEGDPRAPDALRRAYTETDPARLVTQMPFLGWAELAHAGAGPVAARDALVRMRELMWAHQIRRADTEPWDRDLRGAIVFTGAQDPAPTSGVLRPVAFACTMLGDERLTPGTIGDPTLSAEVARLADALRFVRQLSMDRSSAFLSVLPGVCVGSVRRSLWDWRLAPSDTALALLAVLEFERSLSTIKARGAPEAENP